MDGTALPYRQAVLTAPAAGLPRFITLEGGEGAGKSTHARRVAAWLETRGARAVLTREPGGSPGGEAVRRLVVEGTGDRWSTTAELFLFLAARVDHLERVIRPALATGAWVVSDRFWDSTRVYQGLVGGLDLAMIDQLHETWLSPFRPTLTIVLDLPADEGLQRAHSARFEAMGLGFHRRVRQAFLDLAAAEPQRLAVVDATGNAETVASAVEAALAHHLDGSAA